MPDLWMPGAIRVPATGRKGGSMTGSAGRYFTWHTFEGRGVQYKSAEWGAAFLNRAGTTPTFCLNPLTGEVAQMLPADVSCYTLENAPGNVETNRAGTVHMQVEVLAEAREPFTGYMTAAGWDAVARLVDFAESWGVPRSWPAGPPAGSHQGPHNRIGPAASGHYGHSQWLDQPSGHWDPGAVDTRRILLSTRAPKPDPDIKKLQLDLVEAGLLTPADVDGIDGPKTQAAKEAYVTQLDRIEGKIDDLIDRQASLATRKASHLMVAILQALRDEVIPEKTEEIKAAVAALDHDDTETGASA